jgi:hypothetical protein
MSSPAYHLTNKLAEEIADAPAANYEENDYNAGFIAGLDHAKALVCWVLHGCDTTCCDFMHPETEGGAA